MQIACIGSHEGGTGWRSLGRQRDEALADVDADHLDPPPGESVGVAPGSAADVEDPHARLQPQLVDEEPDLLLGAAGERVAEVGPPQVVRQRLEPVHVADVSASRTGSDSRPRSTMESR